MNKKIVGVVLCLLMLTVIPVAVGMQSTVDENDALLKRTVVRGVILNSKTEGRTTTFFALYVHYATYGLMGEIDSGVLMLKRVSFNGKFNGFMGKFYVAGSFWGSI